MKILITGVAGFIGFHLSKKLIIDGHNIIGLDNINDYYDVSLKEARLEELFKIAKDSTGNIKFFKGSLEDIEFLNDLFY